MEGQIHSVFWTCPTVIQILAEVKPVAKIWMHIVDSRGGSQETPIGKQDLEKRREGSCSSRGSPEKQIHEDIGYCICRFKVLQLRSSPEAAFIGLGGTFGLFPLRPSTN